MVSANLGVLHYVLDHIYAAFIHRTKLSTPFFSRGWGGNKLDLLERMVKQLFPEAAAQNWPPNLVQPIWKTVWETKDACLREGAFRTPCDKELIDALPPESHIARVAFLVPKFVPPQKMACVVHLAGTGDHTFERRLRLGGPLLKQNIATMVLESPYYGHRRPRLQSGAKLLCVSDLLLLGRATIDEARSLLHWLEVEAGFGKTGICGLSMGNEVNYPRSLADQLELLSAMNRSCAEVFVGPREFPELCNVDVLLIAGGVHAAMVGSLHPTPVATLPFLAPHSAVVAFCEGILKYATAWEALREDAAQKTGMTVEQVKERLRSVLSLTDVTRFPIPKNPRAVIFVSATDDGYIPRHSVLELQRAWPGSEVRWVTGGHVSSFLLHSDAFRKAIVDALNVLEWRGL